MEGQRRKQPVLFLKLDIAKAFDSVRWDFLLEVLEKLGFQSKWRAWISALLGSSSTAVLLNGVKGKWFKHYTGLRQGDPLSPLLFIIAMEPLQRMFDRAARDGLLTHMGGRVIKLRASLYADDAAVFFNPLKHEVQVVATILHMFGQASGLHINLSKCAVYPIHCDNVNMEEVMEGFPCPVKDFPCSYLGLPLHTRQLRRVDIQPIIDKVANRLPAWRGSFLNKAARLKLVNTVLSSIPVYFLTVFNPKKWAVQKIDKIRRAFLWNGSSEARGSQCLVAWDKIKRPKLRGGMGILDLEKFSRALRLRWLWYRWEDPDRPWVGSEVPCSEVDKQLFRCSTVVTLGDGRTALFWESAWSDGVAPRDFAPHLYKLAWRKGLTVREEVEYQTWTRGLWRMSTADEMVEFVLLWEKVQEVFFSDEPDRIIWKWTKNGLYSSKSAYEIQFVGSYCTFNSFALLKAKAEGKHCFFGWLFLQEKIQTADNLLLKGIECDPVCCLSVFVIRI